MNEDESVIDNSIEFAPGYIVYIVYKNTDYRVEVRKQYYRP